MPKKPKLRVEQKSAQQKWNEARHQAGLCYRCGAEPRDWNPRTGKPYRFGPICRPVVAAERKIAQQRYRDRLYARGLNARGEPFK